MKEEYPQCEFCRVKCPEYQCLKDALKHVEEMGDELKEEYEKSKLFDKIKHELTNKGLL